MALSQNVMDILRELYGIRCGEEAGRKLEDILGRYGDLRQPGAADWLDEKDIMLITYADNLRQSGRAPLVSLHQFITEYLDGLVNIVHLLPFFSSSSDDGFAVIDYRQVDSNYGEWRHVEWLTEDVNLCFDLVINHVSASSRYFKGYLQGDSAYHNFFIEVDPDTDVSSVVRPRALPLLHEYAGMDGPKWLWTTFSEDQIDLNFCNPHVLLEMIDVLLGYVAHGARIIRLDAIAYLWKQPGTSCLHLPQTHLVVKLLRKILDEVAPHILLLTETNVPHEENISYFGDGRDEAQIVYNFPLPPLVLHTLATGNARRITDWAKNLRPVSDRTTFLNFTASHDGIGVRPAADLLNEKEFNNLIALAQRRGGDVSYKNDHNGRPIPYELNITYYDALNDPFDDLAIEEVQIARFLCSQAIALALQGVPAIYLHSLLGSRNWTYGVQEAGRLRSINREKLDLDLLENILHDASSRRARVLNRYSELIRIRQKQKAFHPNAPQVILDVAEAIFALRRQSIDGREILIALHNITGSRQYLTLTPNQLQTNSRPVPQEWLDVISGERFTTDTQGSLTVMLPCYQVRWLTAKQQA
ncbi:MAG: sugar phosphorylase [Sedimentisphaerales bacterium]|nr:sugar phosphorylase [Sedimentisphaerales bacterium]